MLHRGILLFVFFRPRPDVERLRPERSPRRTEPCAQAGAQATQARKWVVSVHAVHAIVEKSLTKRKMFFFCAGNKLFKTRLRLKYI